MNKRHGLIGALMASTLLLVGCGNTMSQTLATVQESINNAMDNHDYKVVPFEWLLTETDRSAMVQPVIPPLQPVDFTDLDASKTLEVFTVMLDLTEELLSDYDFYLDTLDSPEVFESLWTNIYTSPDSVSFFTTLMEDAYSEPHRYSDSIDIVGIGQFQDEDSTMWVLDAEWKVLQDSKQYKVYPLSLTFTDSLTYLYGEVGSVSDSDVYTRPLTEDALISENTHESFLDSWTQLVQQVNARGSQGPANIDHLTSVARDKIPLDLLRELYEATDSDLSNGSITEWYMHDEEAEALSTYRYVVPQLDGTYFSMMMTYSRLYDDFHSIERIADEKGE